MATRITVGTVQSGQYVAVLQIRTSTPLLRVQLGPLVKLLENEKEPRMSCLKQFERMPCQLLCSS